MKTLLVLYDKPDWRQRVPYNSELYDNSEIRRSYEMFAEAARSKGLLFGRASISWYKGKGLFSKGWVFEKGWKKQRNIRADVVYDKTPSIPKLLPIKKRLKRDIKVFNDPHLDLICSDKLLTYKVFPKIVPKCCLVHNKKELRRKLKHITTERIVLKPVAGSSAKGLVITKRTKLPKRIPKDTLLQEFIDTSAGIPGFVKGVSDFRIFVCDGRIITAVVRKARPGCLASNVSMGGKMIFVPFNKIPKQIRRLVKAVDSKLKRFKSRLYTADFIFDRNGKLWLMELNSKPGSFVYLTFQRPDLMKLFNNSVLNSIMRLVLAKQGAK